MLQAPHLVGRSRGHRTGQHADRKDRLQAPAFTEHAAQQAPQYARETIGDHGVERLAAPTHAMESLALAAAAGVHVAAFARDLEHGRGSIVGTPLALAMWSAVGLAAAAGLPVVHAGEVTPQMRREE